jgi:hypothetical protein
MHRAPAVSVSTARSRWHLCCILVLSSSGVASLLGFQLELPQPGWIVLALISSILLTTAIAVSRWAQTLPGNLRWDGHRWYTSAFDDNTAPCLTLQLDWGKAILVSLQDVTGHRVWVWLEAGQDAVVWSALRRAVVSSLETGADGAGHSAPRLEGTV